MGFVTKYLGLKNPEAGAGYAAYLPSSLAIWSLLLGCFAILGTVYTSFKCYIPAPFEDQWATIEELASHHGAYTLPLLWAQHNEHRSPFAKLLIMADLYLFKGQNVSLYLELYLIQILHLVTLMWLLRRSAHWPPWLLTVSAGLIAFALFWESQYQSFLNPVQVCYLSAFLLATFSIISMMIALEEPNRFSPWLTVSMVAAFLAEANLANGLIVWLFLILMAVRFRLRYTYTAVLCAVTVVAIAIYLPGYKNPGQTANPVASLLKPGLLIEYLTIYFGSVWGKLSSALEGAFAIAGIAGSIFLFVRELLRPKPRPFPFAVLLLCMFLLATGFITALGRINFPLVQAASSRYQTAALLFWVLLAIYAFDAFVPKGQRPLLMAVAGVLGLSSIILPSFAQALRDAETMADRVNAGALPIYSDVKDYGEIQKLVVSADLVFQDRPFLMEHETAFYADPRFKMLGKPVHQVFQTAAKNRCVGYVDTARENASAGFPGWELKGWAWDGAKSQVVESIVTATADGTILGSGVANLSRPDLPINVKAVTDPNAGFRAYVRGPGTMPMVWIYGVVDGGKYVCPVAVPTPLPVPKR